MIVIDWVLVGLPEINITGSPIGTICCYAVTTLLNIVFICIKIKERPRFLRVFVRPAICTAIMGFAAWGIYNVLHGIGPLSDSRFGMLVCLAVSIVAAVIIYFVLIILLRAVTKEDMKFIPKGEKIAKLLHIR